MWDKRWGNIGGVGAEIYGTRGWEYRGGVRLGRAWKGNGMGRVYRRNVGVEIKRWYNGMGRGKRWGGVGQRLGEGHRSQNSELRHSFI